MSLNNTNTVVNLLINGQEALQTLQTLKTNALGLEQAIAKAAAAGNKVELRKLRRSLADTKKQIREIESSTMQVEVVMSRLDKATPKELAKTLSTLNKQLEYLERGTAAWDEHVEKIKKVKAEITALNATMREGETFWGRMNRTVNNWSMSIMGAIATIYGFVMAGRNAVKAYADMDEEMANTRKYTGMTREEVEGLNSSFKKLNTRTSRAELNELAQEAGRLGKNTRESVQGYVEAADIIRVALVDLGDGATQTIAKLTNIFGVEQLMGTKDAMLAVGSTVNVLSQNCTASKPYLVDFAQRMAGIGAQSKMTIPQILAFGATLDANGQKVEMSSSAISKLIMKLFQDTSGIAKQVGLDVDEFTATLQKSTNEGLLMFLERIRSLGSKDGLAVLAPMFKDLGMDGVRMAQVLATLAEHLDMVRWEQKEANKAFTEASSATREYNIFNNTTQASLDKARNRVHELAVQLGENLLPVMRHVYSSTSLMLRVLNTIVSFVINNRTAIIGLTAAVVAYNSAVIANTAYTKACTAAQTLWNGIMKTATVLWQGMKVLGAGMALVWERIVWQTRGASEAQVAFNRAVKATPWGAVAAAATALGVAIYEVISRLREMTSLEKIKNEIEQKVNETTAEQTLKVTRLNDVVKDNTKSNYDRVKAIDALKAIIPEYNSMIDEEGNLIRDNTQAVYDYIEALKKEARVKAAQEKMVEIEKEILDIDTKISQQNDKIATASDTPSGALALSAKDKAKLGLAPLMTEKAEKEELLNQVADWAGTSIKGLEGTTQSMEKVNQELYKTNSAYKKAVDKIEREYREGLLKQPDGGAVKMPKPDWNVKNNKGSGNQSVVKTPFKIEDRTVFQIEAAGKNAADSLDKVLDKRNTALYELNKKYANASGDTGKVEVPVKNEQQGKGGSSQKVDRFAKEKEWKELQEAYARIAYATGSKVEEDGSRSIYTYENYTKDMDSIAIEYYRKMLEHEDLSFVERKKLEADYYEAVSKSQKDNDKLTLEEEQRRYDEQMAETKQYFIDGKYSLKTYHLAVEQQEITHLKNVVNIYKEGSEEKLKAEKKYQDALLQAALKAQQEQEKKAKEHQQKLQKIKEHYLHNTFVEDKKGFDEEMALLMESYTKMVSQLDEVQSAAKETASESGEESAAEESVRIERRVAKDKLKIAKDLHKAKLALLKKYNQEEYRQSMTTQEKMTTGFLDWLESDGGQAIIKSVETVASGISSIISGITEIVQAELEIETAAIEKKYDAQISLAEGNTYREKQLEEQKEKEIAKAKSEANKKAFAMQVINAVAQTALSAINAYSSAAAIPLIGWIMAPIAAATAIAAGMVQIAAIKKQQQASEAQGYAEGGYTKKGAKDEEAGVVHAGEWVASQELLANPVASQMIETLDQAQRTNTIGSLKAEDVSRSITAPVRIADSTQRTATSSETAARNTKIVVENNTGSDQKELSSTLSQLNRRLSEPFVTINTVEGNYGIERAQEQYNRLVRNKTPKSSR